MSNSIIDGTNIDYSVFSYSAPKPHASGSKVVNLFNKTTKESLRISTPLMLTWGAQEGVEKATGAPTGKWSMSLQFAGGEYATPEGDAFLAGMKGLVKEIKRYAMEHSKEWFGKEIKSEDVIDEKFGDMLKYPKKVKGGVELDETRPPTLAVKIPQWSGSWKSEIYDEDRNPLYINGKVNTHLTPLEFLTSKSHVICLIECGGLWFINGKISITWNLKQAIVQKPKDKMEGTCFLLPKESDKQALKALPPKEEEVYVDNSVTTTIVEDSDDDADDEPLPLVKVAVAEPVAVIKEEPKVEEPKVEEPKVEEPKVEEVKEKKKILRKKA